MGEGKKEKDNAEAQRTQSQRRGKKEKQNAEVQSTQSQRRGKQKNERRTAQRRRESVASARGEVGGGAAVEDGTEEEPDGEGDPFGVSEVTGEGGD